MRLTYWFTMELPDISRAFLYTIEPRETGCHREGEAPVDEKRLSGCGDDGSLRSPQCTPPLSTLGKSFCFLSNQPEAIATEFVSLSILYFIGT